MWSPEAGPSRTESPDFAVWKLRPYRIQILCGADVAAGRPSPIWTSLD
nr:hypothetical protein [Kibdelosporangium sp. MJ126-NF4]CTQ99373.1 hypothetical protein [Kibdelosporangium sp. MJ126-NF4]